MLPDFPELPNLEGSKNWKASGRKDQNNNNIITGAFLLLAGTGVLLKNMNVGIPDWVFSWEVLLIGIGLFIGLRHHFKGPLWIILILIGGISLQDQLVPGASLKQFTWPAILIVLGLYFMFRPKSDGVRRRKYEYMPEAEEMKEPRAETYAGADRVDVTAILGNIKKVVVSKNFKGGDLTTFLGGAELNLSQADINGRIRIDVTTFMGGAKIIVPASWDVQSDMVAVFGGVEDKRDLRPVNVDPKKVLVLDGMCLFGGIEIKCY